MGIHQFDSPQDKYISIDNLPDFRSDVEKMLTPISIYNHDKPDLAFAERTAEEVVNVSGAIVTVYARMPKGDSEQLEVWDEDTDPVYDNGKMFKAYFKPEPILTELTKWGVDVPIRVTIVFTRTSILKIFGNRMLQPGDVIQAPYNLPDMFTNGIMRFRILNAAQEGFFMYRWLYIKATCELLTGDSAVSIKFNNNGNPEL
jgi:hypothetical protein